jgi:riboflavin kinase/FMN adenylyltransferase
LRSSTIFKNEEIDSIAIGGFDGIHIGHQALISKLTSNGLLIIVDKGNASLTPSIHRCKYLDKKCLFLPLEDIKHLTASEFIDFIKSRFINLKKIVVGYDFKFGKYRKGNAYTLKEYCLVDVDIVDEVIIEGVSVHSRTIKNLIKDDKIEQANRLLGRHYCLFGTVIKGQGLGKKELFATLNLDVKEFLIPSNGVYASFSKIGDKRYPSVTFIGNRVSVDNQFSIETHILDKNIEEIVDNVEICFVQHIRKNMKFDTLHDLKNQIALDIKQAKEILQKFYKSKK